MLGKVGHPKDLEKMRPVKEWVEKCKRDLADAGLLTDRASYFARSKIVNVHDAEEFLATLGKLDFCLDASVPSEVTSCLASLKKSDPTHRKIRIIHAQLLRMGTLLRQIEHALTLGVEKEIGLTESFETLIDSDHHLMKDTHLLELCGFDLHAPQPRSRSASGDSTHSLQSIHSVKSSDAHSQIMHRTNSFSRTGSCPVHDEEHVASARQVKLRPMALKQAPSQRHSLIASGLSPHNSSNNFFADFQYTNSTVASEKTVDQTQKDGDPTSATEGAQCKARLGIAEDKHGDDDGGGDGNGEVDRSIVEGGGSGDGEGEGKGGDLDDDEDGEDGEDGDDGDDGDDDDDDDDGDDHICELDASFGVHGDNNNSDSGIGEGKRLRGKTQSAYLDFGDVFRPRSMIGFDQDALEEVNGSGTAAARDILQESEEGGNHGSAVDVDGDDDDGDDDDDDDVGDADYIYSEMDSGFSEVGGRKELGSGDGGSERGSRADSDSAGNNSSAKRLSKKQSAYVDFGAVFEQSNSLVEFDQNAIDDAIAGDSSDVCSINPNGAAATSSAATFAGSHDSCEGNPLLRGKRGKSPLMTGAAGTGSQDSCEANPLLRGKRGKSPLMTGAAGSPNSNRDQVSKASTPGTAASVADAAATPDAAGSGSGGSGGSCGGGGGEDESAPSSASSRLAALRPVGNPFLVRNISSATPTDNPLLRRRKEKPSPPQHHPTQPQPEPQPQPQPQRRQSPIAAFGVETELETNVGTKEAAKTGKAIDTEVDKDVDTEADTAVSAVAAASRRMSDASDYGSVHNADDLLDDLYPSSPIRAVPRGSI